MKKFFSFMVVAAAFAFVGCGNANQPAAEAEAVADEAVEVVELLRSALRLTALIALRLRLASRPRLRR